MANIHLIGGEKGGVGKSMVARVIAQYLIDKEIPFRGFDTDRSHRSLLRFYSDYAAPVAIDRYESLDTMVETATENPETVSYTHLDVYKRQVMHLSSLNNGLVIKGLLALCYGVAECGRRKFDATSQVWCSDLMISE